jgi:hypothetical protein
MPRVGFEATIPVFERAKMVHALDGVATVVGISSLRGLYYLHEVAGILLSAQFR